MARGNHSMLDRFWNYIYERAKIRERRRAGFPRPWTRDDILNTYRFTNVKREWDRTTIELYAQYARGIVNNDIDPEACLLNAGLGRYFGTSEFYAAIGWHTAWNKKARARVLKIAKERIGHYLPVFTGAYVITNGGTVKPKEEYVCDVIDNLWGVAPKVVAAMQQNRSWGVGYTALRQAPGFGGMGFMAKEVLQDYLLMRPQDVDDGATWTPVGPGGRRGMNRVKGRLPEHNQKEEAFISEVLRLRDQVNPRWQAEFSNELPLTAHDVQFCLCEFDKYERARKNEGKLKRIYTPCVDRQAETVVTIGRKK